jgi:hypothetical protein
MNTAATRSRAVARRAGRDSFSAASPGCNAMPQVGEQQVGRGEQVGRAGRPTKPTHYGLARFLKQSKSFPFLFFFFFASYPFFKPLELLYNTSIF